MDFNLISDAFSGKNFPINTEEYETYLELKLAISKLVSEGVFDSDDMKILENFMIGDSSRKSAKVLKFDRRKVMFRLRRIFFLLKRELQ